MSIIATMNVSILGSGGIGGPTQVIVPPLVTSNSPMIQTTVNLSAGFTPLVSLTGANAVFGGGITLTNASGMWLIPPSGSTPSAIAYNTAANAVPCGQFPVPVFISGGFTLSNIGVCLSAATTVEIIVF